MRVSEVKKSEARGKAKSSHHQMNKWELGCIRMTGMLCEVRYVAREASQFGQVDQCPPGQAIPAYLFTSNQFMELTYKDEQTHRQLLLVLRLFVDSGETREE